MKSTYDILGIPEALTNVLGVFALIILLAPYAMGQDFGILKVPDFGQKARRPLQIIGPLLLFLIIMGFVPVWGSKESNTSWVKFQPIPKLATLKRTFSVPTVPPPKIDLSFRSKKWDLNLPFQVSSNLEVRQLKSALLDHFAFKKCIEVDYSTLPTVEDCWWEVKLVLTINGHQISERDEYSSTLADVPLKSGDVLGFKLVWELTTFCSSPAPQGVEKPSPPLDL